ncbi:Uncharacterised protein g6747 [Pycnogonum litorale]
MAVVKFTIFLIFLTTGRGARASERVSLSITPMVVDVGKSVGFSCRFQSPGPNQVYQRAEYYQNGELVLVIGLDAKKSVAVLDFKKWNNKTIQINPQQVQVTSFTVTSAKPKLTGNYTCMLTGKSSTNSMTGTSEPVHLIETAHCSDTMPTYLWYGEDGQCQQKITYSCLKTTPEPEFRCAMRNTTTGHDINEAHPKVKVSHRQDGLLDVESTASWNLRNLVFTDRYDVDFYCTLKAPGSGDVNVTVPPKPLSAYQCDEPKIKNGKVKISRYNCLGKPDIGSVAQFQCDYGYMLQTTGLELLYCRNNRWLYKYDDKEPNFNSYCVQDPYPTGNPNGGTCVKAVTWFLILSLMATQ